MKHKLGCNVAQYTGPQPTSPQFLRDLDRMVALRMYAPRIDVVPWYTQGGKDLSDPRDKLTAAKTRGLHTLAMLPHWLHDKTQVLDVAALSTFATNVATVLGNDHIDIIELGNECGSPDFTGGQVPIPGFQAVVSAIYIDALRSAGFTGKIITPGLAPVAGAPYVTIIDFLNIYWPALDAQYRAEIAGTGVHIYSPPYPGDRAYFKSWAMLDAASALTGKPFYVTELNILGLTGRKQAAALTDAFTALDARSDVSRAWIYEMSDQSPDDAASSYGLYSQTGSPRATLGSVESWQGLPATAADPGTA